MNELQKLQARQREIAQRIIDINEAAVLESRDLSEDEKKEWRDLRAEEKKER